MARENKMFASKVASLTRCNWGEVFYKAYTACKEQSEQPWEIQEGQ